jgi:hypothetical protein
VSKENVQTELSSFESLIDTSSVLKIEIDQFKLKIIETIITKRYDKVTGVITEETTTEREIAQDTDKVVAETEERKVTEENDILLKYKSDFSKTADSEETLESIGAQESFGKWFGIGISLIIGVILLYLWAKISR